MVGAKVTNLKIVDYWGQQLSVTGIIRGISETTWPDTKQRQYGFFVEQPKPSIGWLVIHTPVFSIQ
jgi:hypothetical protein